MPCAGVCLGSVGAGVPSWTPQFLWLPKPGFLLFSSSIEKLPSHTHPDSAQAGRPMAQAHSLFRCCFLTLVVFYSRDAWLWVHSWELFDSPD